MSFGDHSAAPAPTDVASPDVHALREGELDALRTSMPSWNDHEYARRAAAQARGELVQIVAWHAGAAVGMGMVLFPGYEEYSTSAERERCAEVRDVSVAATHRRQGIATAIIGALERAASEHGMPRIGMAVALDEEGAAARSLYARLGYRRAHGPFVTSTSLEADDGGRIPVGAIFDYLVKDLSAVEDPLPPQKQ